jgi:hypothetical protein
VKPDTMNRSGHRPGSSASPVVTAPVRSIAGEMSAGASRMPPRAVVATALTAAPGGVRLGRSRAGEGAAAQVEATLQQGTVEDDDP